MSSIYQNMIILGLCWLIVTGGGIYVTFFDQPSEMERLEKAEKVARMKQAELAALMAEASETEDRSSEMLTRWNARYKLIPKTLAPEAIIGYLNELTATGFKPFDIVFRDHIEGDEFNTFRFDLSGRGKFARVYNLVWSLENNRQLYRVSDLKLTHFDLITRDEDTQVEHLDIVVDFDFKLDVYYGGAAGLSADDEYLAGVEMGGDPIQTPTADISQLPDGILPDRKPGRNPFFPLIMENIPPNSHGLLNLEEAKLISIVGGKAVFEWNGDYQSLGVGEDVYLGQLTSIDPQTGIVHARLNKGGIIDEIELSLSMGDSFRQAVETVNLGPGNN